jgi:hypothetical protein
MATNFYFGGSIDADFKQFKEWEKQEKIKENLKKASTKSQYRAGLNEQLIELNLGKINMKKGKKVDLIEVNKRIKQEEIQILNQKKAEAQKKMQLKEVLQNDLQDLKQRRLWEKQKDLNDPRNAGELIEKMIQAQNQHRKFDNFRRNSEESAFSGKNHLGNMEISKRNEMFSQNTPKKYFDMGNDNEKKEFFKAISEKQLKMEKNYSKIVKKDEKEKSKVLENWIERGKFEEIKKFDERIQQEKNYKESLRKEVKSGLESQLKMRNELKEQEKREDKAYAHKRDTLIQQDLEKEMKMAQIQRKEREKYKEDLKKQMKNSNILEAYHQRVTEDSSLTSRTPKSLQSLHRIESRGVTSGNDMKLAVSPYKPNAESQIHKSPVERFTGSLIMQSPKENQPRFSMASIEQSPTISRALYSQKFINLRPKENQ